MSNLKSTREKNNFLTQVNTSIEGLRAEIVVLQNEISKRLTGHKPSKGHEELAMSIMRCYDKFMRVQETTLSTDCMHILGPQGYSDYMVTFDQLHDQLASIIEVYNNHNTANSPIPSLDVNPSIKLMTSIENQDLEGVLKISWGNFIGELDRVPQPVLKKAYADLLYKFLLDLRNGVLVSSQLPKKLADSMHNLPNAIASDLEGFNHEYFWKGVFARRGQKSYLLANFMLSIFQSYLIDQHRG